jgi:hypothetical protein
MPEILVPLSPTVAAIFSEFLKKLQDENVLGASAIEALGQALEKQKLDPESLRKAMVTPAEGPQ